MPGLDIDIVVHRLPTKEGFLPVKQKVRRMRPEMSEQIKAEVMKQFNAGFLAVTSYPQWVANVLPVPKKDGKVQRCGNNRNLNKGGQTDFFPFPHIVLLFNTPPQKKFFPFMDVF